MESKQCTKCGETKELTDENWHKMATNKDGYQAWCKTCHNVGRGPERAERNARGTVAGVKINLERLQRRLLTTLNRDSLHLFRAVQDGKLDRDDTAALHQYIKLTNGLLANEAVKEKELTDEQLEAIANQKPDAE